MLVLNKRNEVKGNAVELENGKFEITFENGDAPKTVAASTFKRWYKVLEEEVTVEETKEENTVSLETVQNDIEMEEQMDAEIEWNEQHDQEVQKENDWKEIEEHLNTPKIEVGSFVEMVDGTVGKVEDIMGDLATVATINDEVPVKLDQLKLTDKRPEIKVVTEQPIKEELKEVKKPKKQTTPKKEKVEEIEVKGLQIYTEIAEGAKSEKSIHFLVHLTIGNNEISFKKACFRKNLQGRITKANVNGEELKGNSISITKVLEPIGLSKEEQKYVRKVVNDSIKQTAETEK